MAFKTYAQWLKDNRLTSSAANAANWNRQYGPGSPNAQAAPAPAAPEAAPAAPAAPPPPPPPPAYDPNYIDAQGQTDLSNLTAERDRLKANAIRQYDLNKANIDAQRPGIERNRVLGIDRTQSSAAARGMFRSGARVVGEGRVNTDAAEQNSGLDRQHDQYAFDRDTAQGQADAAYATGRQGIYSQAGARRLDQYRQQWGI